MADVIDRPLVHVVLATYNGFPWISKQVRGILEQEDVNVDLVVTDDGSTDGTYEWLLTLARRDPRVQVLDFRDGPPGVGANFLYGFESIEQREGEYLAFSDQDDIWHPRKLSNQIEFMKDNGAAATSSNVVSFGDDGQRTLIRKDQPQREWDFIFEAPGPGSTFVLSKEAADVVRSYIRRHLTVDVWLHDWFIYCLVRSAGLTWVIDSRPHVGYRQHEHNVLGEHRGLGAMRNRLCNMRTGKYRAQFILMADAGLEVARANGRDPQWISNLEELAEVLRDRSIRGRLRLARYTHEMRRVRSEGLALSAAQLLGLW